MTAESAGRDRGATFIVRLPAGATTDNVEAPVAGPQTRGVTVLLVDDDETARDVLRRTLEHFGAKVTEASTAKEALALVSRQPFDLVLTDIAMPEYDGYWLLQEIRKLAPRIRVAALTALRHSDDQIAAASFDAYLRKPVEPERLGEILNRFSA